MQMVDMTTPVTFNPFFLDIEPTETCLENPWNFVVFFRECFGWHLITQWHENHQKCLISILTPKSSKITLADLCSYIIRVQPRPQF